MKYVRLRENNDWEGETWFHFLRLDGNEKAIERLRAALAMVFDGDDYPVFSLSTKTFEEETVDTLIEEQEDSDDYLPKYTKLDGKLKLPKTFKADYVEINDMLYKGGIEKWVK